MEELDTSPFWPLPSWKHLQVNMICPSYNIIKARAHKIRITQPSQNKIRWPYKKNQDQNQNRCRISKATKGEISGKAWRHSVHIVTEQEAASKQTTVITNKPTNTDSYVGMEATGISLVASLLGKE